ncbi:MAG: 3-deoxy-8-phosphooctulonate synthase, partial [Acetobacteraceae bacterium]
MSARVVRVGPLELGNDRPLVLIAGPCQIESRAHALEVASALAGIARAAGIGLVFKASYDKANRTSLAGARGVGLEEGLSVLAEIRSSLGLPVLT